MPFFLYPSGENKFAYSNKLLPFNMKSIKQIQKYLHIIKFYACVLWIFIIILLFLMNFQTFRDMFNSKTIKACLIYTFRYKAIQWVSNDSYSSRFIIYVSSFILDKLCFEETPLNLGWFWQYYCISKIV